MAEESSQAWESRLDSVVVYAQGAVCRRRARGVLPADGRVRLAGLPRSLTNGSLRARVLDAGPAEGAPEWMGTALRVTGARVEFAAELRDRASLPELRRRVDAARDERDAVAERHARAQARIGEVAALRPVPPERTPEEPHRRTPADAWLELADFVERRLADLHARAAELEDELRLAEHALEVTEAELARVSSAVPAGPVETSAVAVVTVTAAPERKASLEAAVAAGREVELEVEYCVPGARWVPTYQLSHRQGEATGRLVLRASIAQRSGEDWEGVRLALSTADLQRRTDLPVLRSVRIGRSQPAPAPSGWREPPSGLGDLFTGYDAVGPRPLPATTSAPPTPPGSAGAAGAGGPWGGEAAELAAFGGYGGYGAPESPYPAPPPMARPVPPPAPMPVAAPMPAAPAGPVPQAYGGGGQLSVDEDVPRGKTRARAAAPAMPAAPGGVRPGFAGAPPGAAPAAQPVPVPPAPPQPSAGQLDYGALALSGPEDPAGRRGLLHPGAVDDPVTLEQRRRAAAPAELALPAHAVPPRRSAGSFDYRYDAAAPADIPSDGGWHTVAVAELPVGLRTEYVCVPSVEEAVYATLVLSNATERALLAGPVEVTVDGDFLLTAALPTLAPGGARRVGLGQAEGIRVARRTELRESTAGLRGSTAVLDHRVRVELANRLPHPVTVEVRERVPVTSEQDVRIEERADWTPPDTPSQNYPPSARRWRVELAPGATAELDGGYEIRIPAGKALVGGNRRS
ncbi:DUF4139 domain-containing protein [Kitasatospora camelliae]|uniref:DUF4139 domain-containing protein n=1 Tax=Kitasatospora camelliae TaxID=3156397 RepID=A0AAU8K1I1_9ACTN